MNRLRDVPSRTIPAPRWGAWALLLLALLGLELAGCGIRGRAGADSNRAISRRDVPVPPGIEPQALAPLTGEALARARTPTAQVFEQLPVPLELAGAEADGVPERPEPPLAAQRAYVAGRAALREGDREQAIAQLEQVLRLAPHSAAAMRLLGQVYAAANDPIRAARYFADAVKADPTHAPSLYAVGRFALEQGDWARGAALIHAAMQRADTGARRDATIIRLGRYYLAAAFARMGYQRAAVEHYEAFLADEGPIRGDQGPARELAILRQQRRVTWQTLGDLYHQLDRPADAQHAYDTAATLSDQTILFDLVPRRVYTLLRLGRADAARELVMQEVERTHGGEAALELVSYLPGDADEAQALSQRLLDLAARDDQADAATLTIAAAALRPPEAAQQLLRRYLAEHPDAQQVVERLFEYWLDDTPAAIRGTAELMARHPRHAETYALTLLNEADDPIAFAAAFEALPHELRSRAMARVLEGLALAGVGRVDEAQHAFETALELDGDLHIARLQLAKVMVARGRFDDAAALLEPIGETSNPSVVALRVRVLTETGDAAAALALLDRLIDAGEADPSLILQKARLQVALGDAEAGERTLLDALNLDPTREAYYEALFQMYDATDASGRALIRDGDVQYRRLMRRMLGLIPDSRIGKIKRAELHAAAREYGQAIALLSSLAEQDHRDLAALRQLLEVLIEADRTSQAVELLDGRLERFGRDPQLLQLAAAFFGRIGDAARQAQVQEHLFAMMPEGDEKLFSLASLYVRSDRAAEAVQLLRGALEQASAKDPVQLMMLLALARIEAQQADRIDADFEQAFARYPAEAADLHYRWAITYTMRGDEPGYQQALQRTHEKFPDHAPTNNDLGYLWAEQHKNLEQALAMVRKAVDAEPDNAAYLDSLGWVYYKLGRFDDAVVWLRKSEAQVNEDLRRGESGALATQVVVTDHLGDALYRRGDQSEANLAWRRAQRVLNNMGGEALTGNAELMRVRQSLAEKIAAYRNQAPAPVAEVPGQPLPPPPPAADEV